MNKSLKFLSFLLIISICILPIIYAESDILVNNTINNLKAYYCTNNYICNYSLSEANRTQAASWCAQYQINFTCQKSIVQTFKDNMLSIISIIGLLIIIGLIIYLIKKKK